MLLSYCLLLGSALCLAIMAMLRKSYQKNVGSNLQATLWFSALSSLVAFGIGLIISGGFQFEILSFSLAMAYAAMCTTTSILCIVGAKFGSVSGTILCASMGTLVLPCGFGLLIEQNTTIEPLQIGGFLFALLALSVGFRRQKNSENSQKSKKLRWIQLAVFISNGMALVIFKILSLVRPESNQSAFVTEYMFISAIASLILFLCVGRKKTVSGECQKLISKPAIVASVLYAVFFFAADSLAIHCTTRIPLTIQAPLSFCLPIIFTAILEFTVYRQKLRKDDYVQMLFAILCSICFAI